MAKWNVLLVKERRQRVLKLTVNPVYFGRGACPSVRRVLLVELMEEHNLMEEYGLSPFWFGARAYPLFPLREVK